MTNYMNCCNQQPPSYSGVTINITNPALNMQPNVGIPDGRFNNYGYGVPYNSAYQQFPQANVMLPNVQNVYGQAYYPTAGMNMMPYQPNQYEQMPQVPYQQNPYEPMSPIQYPQNPYLPVPYQQIPYQQYPYSMNPNAVGYVGTPDMAQPVNADKTDAAESVKGDYNSGTQNINTTNIYQTTPSKDELPSAYPQQYYIDNPEAKSEPKTADSVTVPVIDNKSGQPENVSVAQNEDEVNTDVSKEIIAELDERNQEEKELEKNGNKTKIVALTNEYIMSLENYLNNPNTDIRLMAAKEVLTRLDEDKDRYDDAALNALLNKMLQDPNKLVRIAALSALSSELASGNDYTVELLNQIQQNPEADPEDVLEASQILLKRAATTEVRYTPNKEQSNQEVENA